MRSTRNLLALVLALALVAAACSSASDDAATDAATEDSGGETASGALDSDQQASAGAGGSARPGQPADGSVADVPDVDLVAAQLDRKIVYTGELRSEVEDLGAAVRSARDSVAAEGGFVFGQEIGEREARVVLKVPSIRFDAAFDAVVGIGKVSSQFIEADDVSEQYTDLDSRRNTLATSIDRLRGFLANASNVDEISRLEGELTRREAEHDVIAGQLRVLEDRTSLGTITATFHLPPKEAEVAATGEESGPPGFARGLEIGWDAVVVMAGAAATAVGFALPFLPVLVLAALALWWQRRRNQPLAAEA